MRAQRSKRSDSPAVSHNPRPLLLMPDIDQSPYKSIEITPVLYTTFLSVFFLFPQKFFWIAKRILAHPRLFSCPCASLHTISIFFPLCFSRLTQTSSSSLELVFFFKGLLEDASLNLLKMTHSLTVDSNDPRSHGGGGETVFSCARTRYAQTFSHSPSNFLSLSRWPSSPVFTDDWLFIYNNLVCSIDLLGCSTKRVENYVPTLCAMSGHLHAETPGCTKCWKTTSRKAQRQEFKENVTRKKVD